MKSSAQKQGRSLPYAFDVAAIIAGTVALYAFLMARYPLIYGGDTIARLVHPSRIINGHQLPLLQVLLFVVLRLHYGPASVFLLMALISGAAAAGMYALICVLIQDRRAALTCAILYALHPFILYYSRVPYQEPLLIAGITWGFFFLFRPERGWNRVLASLCLGAACFARYEGWIAAVVAAAFDARRSADAKVRTRLGLRTLESLFLFGWAPAAWILWNRDLSPAGSYVLDMAFSWGRLYRLYFISKSSLWWTESAVVLFSLLGLVHFWMAQPMRRDMRHYALVILVFLFMLVLPFSGHGIEPDATRIVTEREAFIPITILLMYAGLGASWLLREADKAFGPSRWARSGAFLLLVGVSAGYSCHRGVQRIAAANIDPELKTDYEVARYLAVKNASGLILAQPLPPKLTENYLANVERWSGVRGRLRAEEVLKQAETTPIDYQRVLTYSWLGKAKVFSGDQLKGLSRSDIAGFLRSHAIDYLIIYSDFIPAADHERIIYEYERKPDALIQNGNKAARIYALRRGLD